MAKSVTILDDSLRVHKVTMITPAIRLEFAKMGKVIPGGYTFLPMVEQETGRIAQEKVTVKRVFEGEHLTNTIKRAARWIRSSSFADRITPPRHIQFALMVFNKHDRDGFAAAVNNAHA